MAQINYRGLSIPRTQMGAGGITSDNLFDPNEQVIFDFYEANRGRYRRALDVGANIGVHSILMAQLGWEVRAFEPDPVHYVRLVQNLQAHNVRAEVFEAAMSTADGEAGFVRLLGNTTGSHLIGAKDSYGPKKGFLVKTVDCRPHLAWADFAKIDCEGHEAEIICAADWRGLRFDAMLEVGSAAAARRIYDHLVQAVPMWSQKIEWRRVRSLFDVPAHHSEGSLFVGQEPPFWEGRR